LSGARHEHQLAAGHALGLHLGSIGRDYCVANQPQQLWRREELRAWWIARVALRRPMHRDELVRNGLFSLVGWGRVVRWSGGDAMGVVV